MMLTKQALLGMGLMIGGAVMVLALAGQPKESAVTPMPMAEPAPEPIYHKVSSPTIDMKTEQQIVSAKQQQRQAEVKAQELKVQELLKVQAEAKALALEKAKSDATPAALVVESRPDSIALAKEQKIQEQQAKLKKQQEQQAQERRQTELHRQAELQQQEASASDRNKSVYVVQSGDTLIGLSRRYNVPVSVLAEFNNMGRNDPLIREQQIKIPSAKDMQALQAQVREREKQQATKQQNEQKAKSINERLADSRREAKQKGINDNYAVQVALAANQDGADRLAKAYKQAGYKVQTYKEGKGVRVVIGPERSREAAVALKDKLNNDPNVTSKGAWVLQLK